MCPINSVVTHTMVMAVPGMKNERPTIIRTGKPYIQPLNKREKRNAQNVANRNRKSPKERKLRKVKRN